MNAREMFKSLGYAKKEKNKSIAFYVNEYGDTISFKKTKYVVITPGDGGGKLFINCLLENTIHKQCEELGWVESEQKQETNFEHYKDEIIEGWMLDLALVDGKLKRCSRTDCNECEFNPGANKGCKQRLIEWVKKPYEKPTNQLTQFEYDLLNAYKNSGMRQCISNYSTLLEMYGKGHFKGIDTRAPIHEILDNYEVIE